MPSRYDSSIKYKPGKEIQLADALLQTPTDRPEAEELTIVNNLILHPTKDQRLTEIRSKTWKNPTMKTLTEIIAMGWPSDKRLLPDALKPFFNSRDKLAAQDGLILRRQRIVIRNETKNTYWLLGHKLLS